MHTYAPAGAFGGGHEDERAAAAGVLLSVLVHLLAVGALTLLWGASGHIRHSDIISVALVEPGPAPKPVPTPAAKAAAVSESKAAAVREHKAVPIPHKEKPAPVRTDKEKTDGPKEPLPVREQPVVVHQDVAVTPQAGENKADLLDIHPDIEGGTEERPAGPETVASAVPSPSPSPASCGGCGKAGLESLKDEYARRLKELIERYVHYPVFARKARMEGTCMVVCRMKSTGEVLDVDVEKSTGHSVLDKAAISAVRAAGSLPPVPYMQGDEVLNVSVPVSFSLDGR